MVLNKTLSFSLVGLLSIFVLFAFNRLHAASANVEPIDDSTVRYTRSWNTNPNTCTVTNLIVTSSTILETSDTNLNIATGGTLTNQGSIIAAGNITNSGTINNQNAATIGFQQDSFINLGTVNNMGSISLPYGGQSEMGDSDNSGSLTNDGTIVVQSENGHNGIKNTGTINTIGTVTLTGGFFTNTGTLVNGKGLVDIQIKSSVTNSGAIENLNSGTINFGSSVPVNNNSGGNITSQSATVNNNGVINNNVGASISNEGKSTLTISKSSSINNFGTIANSGGIITTASPDVSDPADAGTITNHAGGVITNTSPSNTGTITNSGILTNNGTITNSASSVITGGGIFTNDFGGGTLTNSGTVIIGGTFTNSGTVNNENSGTMNTNSGASVSITRDGTVTVSGGTVGFGPISNNGQITVNAGTVNLSSTVQNTHFITNSQGGTMTLSGNIQNSGNIENDGIMTNSGAIDNSAGIQNTGSFTNSGSITNNFASGITNSKSGVFHNANNILDQRGSQIQNSGSFTGNSPTPFCPSATSLSVNPSTVEGGNTVQYTELVTWGEEVPFIIHAKHPVTFSDGTPSAGGIFGTTSCTPQTQTVFTCSASYTTSFLEGPTVKSLQNMQETLFKHQASAVSTLAITPPPPPPTLVISSPLNNTFVNTSTPTVSGNASAVSNVSQMTWNVDNGTVSVISGITPATTINWSFVVPTIPDGSHTIQVNATNSGGRITSQILQITIDTVPPGTPDIRAAFDSNGNNLSGGGITNSSSIGITFDVGTGDAGSGFASFQCSLDGASYSVCNLVPQNPNGPLSLPQVQYSGLSDGKHTFQVLELDNAGNKGQPTPSLNWTVNTIPPVISVPQNITQEATGQQTTVTLGIANATDTVDGSIQVTNNATTTYPVGTTVIQYSVTDSAGNTAVAYQTVTITDTTPPTITVPDDIMQQSTGTLTQVNLGTATAVDLVDGTVPVTNNATSLGYGIGTTTIQYTATDSHGNTAVSYQLVTITNAAPTTLTPSKDSFLRSGAKNTNEGANTILMVQHAGQKRTLISFNMSPYENKQVSSAILKLYVVYNGGNWGKGNDRMIEVHKLLSDWAEGNGANFVPTNADEDIEPTPNKGTGSGVTWNCATDTNISNKKADCTTQWSGANFSPTVTDSQVITSTTLGQWVEFDVTSDVNSFLDGNSSDNFGWLVKKTNEDNSGRVGFDSRESTDTVHIPQLVLAFK